MGTEIIYFGIVAIAGVGVVLILLDRVLPDRIDLTAPVSGAPRLLAARVRALELRMDRIERSVAEIGDMLQAHGVKLSTVDAKLNDLGLNDRDILTRLNDLADARRTEQLGQAIAQALRREGATYNINQQTGGTRTGDNTSAGTVVGGAVDELRSLPPGKDSR